jgi:membrane protease YdiL (CAAX protease family)
VTELPTSPSRPGCNQWFALLALALWLAIAPLLAVGTLSALVGHPPSFLVQFELVAPGASTLPEWAFGLLAVLLTLGLQLLAFVPAFVATRRPERHFLHLSATLLVAIALFQALTALARLPWPADPVTTFGPGTVERAYTAALQLALILPFLLVGLGWIEARRGGGSLFRAWRRVGLRLWTAPSALWLALAAAAISAWPWVLVGSLGSGGTALANALQVLPGALGGEILFRGFALAWLWRAADHRRTAAQASLVLYVAAQGSALLPFGDLGALTAFGTALLLGLLVTELTVRAGGSIWPAVAVHFLANWFVLAFVDPRTEADALQSLAAAWTALSLGGFGLVLWLGRKGLSALRGEGVSPPSLRGLVASAGTATTAWAAVLLLYVTMGVPGFHPDGFLIFLDAEPDLGPAASIADPVQRRARVYQQLVDTAERSQAPLRAELERLGVTYRPHYLVNAIEVLERPGLRRRFAAAPGVASVLFQPGVRPYARSSRLPATDVTGPQGVEWNVHQVGADGVWALGYTGQGVVVGEADTGVQWDHPALKAAYLGWNGETASHDYHWYDAWDGRPVPWDDDGHGTHTTGIMVGQDGENKIGLAPGARWIACRNMRHGIGNPGGYLTCMEFLLAPFPLDGDPFHDGDPARGAQVVNNSWGCPLQEGCRPETLRPALEHLQAAGQMMVVSAGNDGPACSTVRDPPTLYGTAFSVGATGRDKEAASFSSRGPVVADGSDRLKPDIVAPGVNIRSSVPGGYTDLPGTSMAGPHVAGATALLWSADPALVGDLGRTETILSETAQHLTADALCPTGPQLGTVCACDGDGLDSVPNNVYGWGLLDVLAAVRQLATGR